MRFASIVFVAVLAVFPVAAGDADDGIWAALAGAEAEASAEELELRDELIASQLDFLTALEEALAEIDGMAADDPRLSAAWARAEYLLEASYRLLPETGEHGEFLKATEGMRPPPAPVAAEAVLTDGAGGAAEEGGGLLYEDASGNPVAVDGAADATPGTGDGVSPPGSEVAVAREKDPKPAPEGAYVPLIKARAAWLRARVLEKQGKTREAAVETEPLGLIRDWLVLGPLESETEANSYINYGLADMYASFSDREYAGKAGPVRWRPIRTRDALGRLYPGALFRTPGTSTAYALALVHSPEDAAAVMRFGSNAPATVCVNHVQGRRLRDGGLSDPDQEAFPVWLRKGWNIVLIRTTTEAGAWGLTARLTARDGSPFPAYVLPAGSAPRKRIFDAMRRIGRRTAFDRHYQAAVPPELGGVSILSDWLVDHPRDARANFYLASFLAARRMMEGPDRFDHEMIFRRATELSNGDPFFTLMAARSVDSGEEGPDREENLRLVLLRAVADQGSAAALVDIGRLYLDVMRQPRRADEYAERALAVNPLSLRAGVLDYDVAVAMGWEPLAKSLLKNLVKRHPSAAAARLRLGRETLADGRPRLALGEFHALLGMDALNREALNGATGALALLGQNSAAVDLLVSHVERFPYDSDMRLKLAELYRNLGRNADAQAVIAAALELAPDDPAALAMRQDIERETYAEGGAALGVTRASRRLRQELDTSPPAVQPVNGWEYLYFQVEDRMERDGSLNRDVSFAVKIYTAGASRMLRHLGFYLDRDFESGSIVSLTIRNTNGSREVLTPSGASEAGGKALKFNLPPLRTGQIIEAEVEIIRQRIPFLGDYFGQIAPLTQQAPVRLSRYMFTAPADSRLFFRPVNGAPEAMVVRSADGGEITRIWEMGDLPAFIPEGDSPGRHALMPCVQVSSFRDWDEFARWYWRLIGVQYHAPPELRLLAESLGGREPNPLVKLDRAADWVAKNIGHREWEYGPYAFRPVNARSILSRLSADGKDRTLFLCLLAREYGLEAWPVLARLRDRRYAPSGSEDLSLPLLDHFNHSLVLVRSTPGGDVFLDASNPYRSPGVMPSQLFGSPGMAISPDEAARVLVPDGGVAACSWEETADLVVDDDGSILWETELKGEGTAAEVLRLRFRDAAARTDAWEGFLVSLGGAPSAAWSEFRESPDDPATAAFSGRARLRHWARTVDERIALAVPAPPGALSQGGFAYPLSLEEFAKYGQRGQDMILPHGFRVARRLHLVFPPEWSLVNPPRPFRAVYPFGEITLACEETSGRLDMELVVEVPGHLVAAADYPAFREFAALVQRWIRPLLVWEKP